MKRPAMLLRTADEAPMQGPVNNSVPTGFAPPTPPQLSPVKPRRPSAADADRPLQSDVTALTADLRKLARGSGAASVPGDKPAGSRVAAADWEHVPLDVWDVVWRGLDLTAQMALCLTSSRFWGRFHGQTVRLLRESELRVANASFAVDVRQGVLLHPHSTVFLRAARPSGCHLWYQLLDAFLRHLPLRPAHRSLTRCPEATAGSTGRVGFDAHTTAGDLPPIELECQLPSTFSTAPAGQAPYDTRHGFCYGHLPANYGGVKLCLLISGSERDAQYWFEDVRLRLRHVPAVEAQASADQRHCDDAAEQTLATVQTPEPTSAEDGTFVLELMSMWPCRRGNAGVGAVPQEGAMYSHAPWLDGS